MWLPRELAMQIGSYLDPHDLRVCTTQLCSSGAGFVSNLFKKTTATILLHELVACCRLSAGVDDIAIEGINRVESFMKRRGSVQTIILDAQLYDEHATNASVYSDMHGCLQQGSSFQLSQNQRITVEWHASAGSIAQVEFLLCPDVQQDDAGVGNARASGALRQYLHTLDLSQTQVIDVSVLASCMSLHTLDLSWTNVSDASSLAYCRSLNTLRLRKTQVSDVSPLASCQSLHTLDLSETLVTVVSVLGLCQSLHTLDLSYTDVSDVTALASCQSLHTLDFCHTQVSDVSALASCQSLHTLDLMCTQVSDVTALASCQSLHTLNLMCTQVSDVTALASCQSLHSLDLSQTQVTNVCALASCQSFRKLDGVEGMIGATEVLRIIEERG
jgi:hypothetical protein